MYINISYFIVCVNCLSELFTSCFNSCTSKHNWEFGVIQCSGVFFISCMILKLKFASMFSLIFLARFLSLGKNLKLYKTWWNNYNLFCTLWKEGIRTSICSLSLLHDYHYHKKYWFMMQINNVKLLFLMKELCKGPFYKFVKNRCNILYVI